ncbi:type II secretion system protein GspN [Geomonas sp. RF6]|uniref:type II secretion system protein GspN n=1 Tax=Geomonas sp. RF6 TaxID=2897342 RepID=UPI001E328FF0|nr:type II secretion system protein GspN [Geomonas sp. RF6]UFS71603.1 type II secretion system protein GspN [Geomonas sp. RF6]
MKRRALLIACGVPAALLLFFLLTLWFIPNDAIKGVLVRVAENGGYTLDCPKLSKAFPIGVKAPALSLSSGKGEVLRLKDTRVALRVLPLLAGKIRFGYEAGIGAAGRIEGDFDAGRRRQLSFTAKGVRLEDIPFFSTVASARVKGELRGDGTLVQKGAGMAGGIQLQVRGAELAGVKIAQTPLPDAAYRDVRGALAIDGGRATLKSFTLDGDGIYVRLKGDAVLAQPVGLSPLNLTVEMMPKPSFLERQKFVFLLLMKYQTSPGAYTIPVRGSLAHPSI